MSEIDPKSFQNTYYLDDNNVAHQVKSLDDYQKCLLRENRRHVALTHLDNNVTVSTVFLTLDHALIPDSKPVLFETMIFGGPHDQDQWRYYTWDQAGRGHYAIVGALMKKRDPREMDIGV